MNYGPIENHGIIGNQETAALVRNDGAIDFMCFPRFDSPTIFASLLDAKKGGSFLISPKGDFDQHQSYLPDSNILQTTFRASHATAVVSDFMTLNSSRGERRLIRHIKAVRGDALFDAVCSPRFGYGEVPHQIEKKRLGMLFIPKQAGLPPMFLRASKPMEQVDGAARAAFRLRGGQSAWFILEEFSSHLPPVDKDSIWDALERTKTYWQNWVSRSKYQGRWRETVHRSALTLALLMSKKEGSLVAAPTFGLPELPGGDRNWDYRFTWVRDTSFALDAFLKLGYVNEARALMGWMEQRCRQFVPERPLQVVYRLTGDRELPEKPLPGFKGYQGSRPVRIGNAACGQLQLDIYGEFVDAIFLYDQCGEPVSLDFWKHIRRLIDWVCDNWMRNDDSIWETRGGARPFSYSRAMCWLAVDRALKLARRRSFAAPMDRWKAARKRIHLSIGSFWNPKLGSFVQYQGARMPDGSLLLLPRVNFFASSDQCRNKGCHAC